MDKDIREISRQRELAESRVEELLLDIENLRSSAKMENQSSSRNITAEKVEEILPRREEQTWENRLSSSLFDGDSLFRSSSFSRASTERAFVEALVQNLQASEEGGVPSVHSFVKVLKEAQAHFERQPDSQAKICIFRVFFKFCHVNFGHCCSNLEVLFLNCRALLWTRNFKRSPVTLLLQGSLKHVQFQTGHKNLRGSEKPL